MSNDKVEATFHGDRSLRETLLEIREPSTIFDLPGYGKVVAPATCEGPWHVAGPGRKKCDCGERRNPSYRTRWQRMIDRRNRKRITRS